MTTLTVSSTAGSAGGASAGSSGAFAPQPARRPASRTARKAVVFDMACSGGNGARPENIGTAGPDRRNDAVKKHPGLSNAVVLIAPRPHLPGRGAGPRSQGGPHRDSTPRGRRARRALLDRESPRSPASGSATRWTARPPANGRRSGSPTTGTSLYFGFKFFDSEPHRINRAILDRGGRISKDDRVVIALDTYLDRRNGYIFEVGSLGTQDDALFTDETARNVPTGTGTGSSPPRPP